MRRKRPFLDHLVRAVGRYQADTGDRLAAAVTFYWFLSLFPILLVAISLFGYVEGDAARKDVVHGLSGYLPGNLITTIADVVTKAKGKAGLIGLIGTLLSGLGWIDALREAIRTMWHQNVTAGNFIVRRLIDILVLVGLFATIAASAFVTALVGSGPKVVLEQLGVGKGAAAQVFLQGSGFLLGALVDVVLFLFLFVRLARVSAPVRQVLKGAVFGAVGFGILKLVGGFYVQHTTTKGQATYGTFAVVVGLLLFLNLVSRLVLLSAAFAVTAPYDSDIRPSGTADREQARRAGVPEEYAHAGLSAQVDGAPTPLGAAVHGKVASYVEPTGEGMEQSWAAKVKAMEPAEERSTVATVAEPPGAAQVQLAARVTAAAGGVLLAAVGIYALRTLKGFARR